MIDKIEREADDFPDFEEYELGADPLDVAMESALFDDDDDDDEELGDGCDEEPDLGDQSFDDFMDAFDFEDPSDDDVECDDVSVWDEEVDND